MFILARTLGADPYGERYSEALGYVTIPVLVVLVVGFAVLRAVRKSRSAASPKPGVDVTTKDEAAASASSSDR